MKDKNKTDDVQRWMNESMRDIKRRECRERIATAALQGMLAGGFEKIGGERTLAEYLALSSVSYADALIAALEEK